jgi:hypothetical protein
MGDVTKRWLALAGLALLLAACGSKSDAKPTATQASAATTATAGPAAGGPTATAADAGGATATASGPATGGDLPRGKLVVSGALSGDLTDAAACGGGVLDEDLQALLSTAQGDDLWFVQIYVNKFKEHGPGDYATADLNSSYDASVTFSQGGHSWGTTNDGDGRVTVNQDGKSGAVEATLASQDGLQPITITGSFVCGAD